ncbi:MAG: hypothetical protein AAF394_12430 [Planctomycetota bacterium]
MTSISGISDFNVTWQPGVTKSNVQLRIESETGELLASESINIQSKVARQRLAKSLEGKCDYDELVRQLMEIADEWANTSLGAHDASSGSDELDISEVHRPERIIAPGLSAFTIPVLYSSNVGVTGKWLQYSFANGERSRVELGPVMNYADRRYFIGLIPPDPSVSDSPGWSRESRELWLDGRVAVDGRELFQRLNRTLDYYIEFAPERRQGYLAVLACWIVLTYVYHAWWSVGYLLVNGPASSGKSTIFNVLKQLCYRPMATDNVSAAAIYRTLHNYGGTLLFDEAERLRDTRSPDIAETNSMLLAGYQKGRGATRLEKVGDAFMMRNYNVFGPKAIACINGVASALQTRCVEISTERAAKDSPKPKRSLEETNWRSLRDDLHVMAIDNGPAWLRAAKRRDIGERLNGRDFEVWQPLLAIGAWFESQGIDGLVDLLLTTAEVSIEDTAALRTPEVEEAILTVLSEFAREGIVLDGRERTYQPTSAEILEVCRERASSLFSRFTPAGIAAKLRPYGVSTSKSGGRREYRTTLEKLRDIQERYGIELDL